MTKKFDSIKKGNTPGSLSEKIIQTTEESASVNVADFMTHGIKKSSMNYSMPIYEILNHLKVHSKIKGIHQFVNEACKDKLLIDFPDICDKFWKSDI